MIKVKVNDQCYDVALFAFDKDGLMFESKHFWIELAKIRAKLFLKGIEGADNDLVQQWLTLLGVSSRSLNQEIDVLDVDSSGILAVASVPEEIAVTAAFLVDQRKYHWTKARELATQIFYEADKQFVLKNALKAKKGFPDILKRIRETGTPYVIATSDTYDRAKESINLFDDFQHVSLVVTSQNVRQGKPNPDMLLYIAEKTGVELKNIMMIGDSYVDVMMASKAGAIGIGIPEEESMREEMQPYATQIINDLDEIIF